MESPKPKITYRISVLMLEDNKRHTFFEEGYNNLLSKLSNLDGLIDEDTLLIDFKRKDGKE